MCELETGGEVYMKEPTYFVISGDEDGDIYVTEETETNLLKRLNPDEHGDIEIAAADVLESLPDTMNVQYWGGPFVLIVKGEIVTPKAVEVVTRFKI